MPRSSSPRAGGGGFYRLMRMLHGYLSAFAFLALMFFSLTGLTLNHPDWLAGARAPESTVTLTLPTAEVTAATKAPEPGRALAQAVARRAHLYGDYVSGDVADGEALIHMTGPRGVSDLTVALDSGKVEAVTRKAGTVAMLNDLHKAKATGTVWRTVVDVSAVLFLVMSVLGYILFFSLRFRLPLALALTAASLVALVAAAMLFVG